MSLQFLEIEIGGPTVAFNENNNVVNVQFTFPQAPNSVFVLLQGFDLEFGIDDNELSSIKIVPTVHHGPGDHGGTIEVRFALVGDSVRWPWNENNLISAHIKLLVVGSDALPNQPGIPRSPDRAGA